jgi:hypothetical protein
MADSDDIAEYVNEMGAEACDLFNAIKEDVSAALTKTGGGHVDALIIMHLMFAVSSARGALVHGLGREPTLRDMHEEALRLGMLLGVACNVVFAAENEGATVQTATLQ